MRKAIGVAALILALTCSAYAGDIQNGTPAPPPPQAVQEATTEGEITNPPLVEFVLSLLALF